MRLSSALVPTASVPWPTSRRTAIFAHLEVARHYREHVVLGCYVRRAWRLWNCGGAALG